MSNNVITLKILSEAIVSPPPEEEDLGGGQRRYIFISRMPLNKEISN